MYLDKILAKHRQIASRDDRPLSDLVVLAEQSGSPRGFADRLREDSKSSLAVIAEVKRRSPSRGLLSQDLQPDVIATQYQRAGASCISVLTDSEFFGGSPEDLQKVRNAADLPVLRKDFTVSLRDICDAKIMNADCILLIAAALSPIELGQFHHFAKELELDVLVEVHDEPELEVAIDVGASTIGVNQRDLKTFSVDQ
ncbi:MAG: indole-3-glycerol-phosphate synthase, partial [Acidimicrobiia bacterium]|nr:indole-3-glycerol-phosphate synthase [Acidimicrobiia bacterium]